MIIQSSPTLSARGGRIPFNAESSFIGYSTFGSIVSATPAGKLAQCGPIVILGDDQSPLNIVSATVHYRVVTPGGSALECTLQDMATAAQAQPDGVKLAIWSGAPPATGPQTHLFASPLNGVVAGRRLAVVLGFYESSPGVYQAGAGATITLNGRTIGVPSMASTYGAAFAASWAPVNVDPLVFLNGDDGRVAVLGNVVPYSTQTIDTFNSASADNLIYSEIAMPYSGIINGLFGIANCVSTNSDYKLSAYRSDGTLIATVTRLAYQIKSLGTYNYDEALLGAARFYAGYGERIRVAMEAIGAGNIQVVRAGYPSTALRDLAHHGDAVGMGVRSSGGVWGAVDLTQRVNMGLLVTATGYQEV